MNANIKRLLSVAEKEKRYIIGLMSGTSLDGLDVALCEVEGSGNTTKLSIKKFTTVNYDEDFKNEVRTVFSKKNIDLQKLCLLNEWIGLKHASIVNNCLEEWNIKNDSIDLIASHGQTIYHAPKSLHQIEKFGNATLQIGDGDHIAVSTGIITISDFRQKHVAAGAEGAPLAVYGDYLLFGKKNEDRILLNIGGIANFTWLPGSLDTGKIMSTDVGPGNGMMDALVQKHFPDKHFDEGSMVAKQGRVSESLLKALKQHTFFNAAFPKTTGPEMFNLDYLQDAMERSGTIGISVEDSMRTLNKFSADMIADAIRHFTGNANDIKIFCSGGGVHNPLLMEHIKDQLTGYSFHSTTELGIHPDAKEAILFAVLANECVCGDPSVFDSAANGMPAISMGKISFPG
jgi:anhydro-N-acetylmuramic acid kinase